MPGPAAGLVPIAFAAGVVRMAAPTIARELIKRGIVKKASQSAVRKAGDNIPKVTKSQAEKLARQGTERKNLQNLNRAQKLDKQPKGEKPYQTLSRAEKQEKAADSARTKLTPRQEAERLKRLNQQQKKQEQQSRQNKQGKQSKQNKQEKPTPPSKPRISDAGKGAIALTAAATGVGGLASLNKKKKQDKKLKPVPEVNVRTLPEPKKVRPAPKKGDNEELNINPKRKKPSKNNKDKKSDDGYRFYGKKGTGLGDFSRKYGMKYATQEQFEKDFDMSGGAKKGGSIKKLAKKKRKGFSGRGAGKALRGF